MCSTFCNIGVVKEAGDIGSRLKEIATDMKVKLLKRYFDGCLKESEITEEMFENYVPSKVSSLDTQIVSSLKNCFLKKLFRKEMDR